MKNEFAEHLARVTHLPVNMPVFLQGYEEVLKGVAEAGRFRLHGLTIDAPAGVYSPHETSSTRFVMDHFFALGLDKPKGRLLEVGCGAGAIAILAAKAGWQVHAADIDPVAVQATRDNAALNQVSLEVHQSDLLSAFEHDRFDAIVFNQPFFHLEREIETKERTLSDFGGQLHVRFMREAREHLTPGGCVILTYSNSSNPAVFSQPGWDMDLRSFDFEAGSSHIRALFRGTPR